jgi:hypothetical protein
MTSETVACPVCLAGTSTLYTMVADYPYYGCAQCGSIHVAPGVLAGMDAGTARVGDYGDAYWQSEARSAQRRAKGLSLCRAGEAILYCRRPVRRFLDVGSGPGFLLQELQRLLDPEADIFHAVEKFPPSYAVACPNFHVGDVGEAPGPFDAGVCIEVVEHLTPTMLEAMARGLARISAPGSLWLFNTGMPDYVRDQDPGYLDPVRRGHVVSYSLAGIAARFEAHGFRVEAMPGRNFGFIVERLPAEPVSIEDRIYRPLQENRDLLERDGLLYHAAFETARSYYYQGGYAERTQWALSLDAELAGKRTR